MKIVLGKFVIELAIGFYSWLYWYCIGIDELFIVWVARQQYTRIIVTRHSFCLQIVTSLSSPHFSEWVVPGFWPTWPLLGSLGTWNLISLWFFKCYIFHPNKYIGTLKVRWNCALETPSHYYLKTIEFSSKGRHCFQLVTAHLQSHFLLSIITMVNNWICWNCWWWSLSHLFWCGLLCCLYYSWCHCTRYWFVVQCVKSLPIGHCSNSSENTHKLEIW